MIADRDPTPEVTEHHSGWAELRQVCQLTVVRQEGRWRAQLCAVAARLVPGAVDALSRATPTRGRMPAAVIALMFAFSSGR